jgi:hypothetical protein
MVPDVRALAAQLDDTHFQGLKMTEKIFEDETHLSVIPFAISRGVRELYRP